MRARVSRALISILAISLCPRTVLSSIGPGPIPRTIAARGPRTGLIGATILRFSSGLRITALIGLAGLGRLAGPSLPGLLTSLASIRALTGLATLRGRAAGLPVFATSPLGVLLPTLLVARARLALPVGRLALRSAHAAIAEAILRLVALLIRLVRAFFARIRVTAFVAALAR